MASDKDRKLLLQELRQIIVTDRMAMELINGAVDTKQNIEKRTEEERKKIIAEARMKRDEAKKRADEAGRERLARRKAEAKEAMASRRSALEAEAAAHSEAWAEEIAGRIIGE